MKTPKNYRLSPHAIWVLDELKKMDAYKKCTETEIVEAAIYNLWHDWLIQEKKEGG